MNVAFSRRDFWNLIDWIVLGIIAAWAIAKSFGWINTPPLIEMIPVFGATFMGGRFVQRLASLETEFREFKVETKSEFGSVKKDVDEIKKELHGTNIRIEHLTGRVAKLEP